MPQSLAIDVLFHAGGCSASRAGTGMAPPLPSPEQALRGLEAAGVDRAFISQCKQWSCERQWMCIDTRLEDVLRFTRHSSRFLGLAGYNPFDIAESVREIEAAAALGFRGVYLHAASFDLPLGDARYYPLFAKAAELGIPVVAQLGLAEPALAQTVRRLAKDIPELTLALVQPRPDGALMQALAADCENLAFVLDPGAMARLRHASQTPGFFGSPVFAERCCWGSNGAALADALAGARTLPLAAAALAAFLAGNTARLFALDQPAQTRTPQSLPSEVVVAET